MLMGGGFSKCFPGSALGGAPSAESLLEGDGGHPVVGQQPRPFHHAYRNRILDLGTGPGGLDGSAGLRWNYSELMPVVTWTGTGVIPLAQWVFLPPITGLIVKWMFLGWLILRAK